MLQSDPKAAREQLGWEPSVSIEQGLQATAEWLAPRISAKPGGPLPAMSDYRIRLSVPACDGARAQYLTRCIDTNYVSSVGSYVEEFERSMADFVGTQHAVACSSERRLCILRCLLPASRPATRSGCPT